jgi:hypothetical protein
MSQASCNSKSRAILQHIARAAQVYFISVDGADKVDRLTHGLSEGATAARRARRSSVLQARVRDVYQSPPFQIVTALCIMANFISTLAQAQIEGDQTGCSAVGGGGADNSTAPAISPGGPVASSPSVFDRADLAFTIIFVFGSCP